MRLVLAIVGPEKLSLLQAALARPDVGPLTVAEVFGYGGRERGQLQIYRGQSIRKPVSKLRIEVMVEDDSLDDVLVAIRRAAFREAAGVDCDDRLFVMGEAECVGGDRRASVEAPRSPALR